jgi:hypothetical protein
MDKDTDHKQDKRQEDCRNTKGVANAVHRMLMAA